MTKNINFARNIDVYRSAWYFGSLSHPSLWAEQLLSRLGQSRNNHDVHKHTSTLLNKPNFSATYLHYRLIV